MCVAVFRSIRYRLCVLEALCHGQACNLYPSDVLALSCIRPVCIRPAPVLARPSEALHGGPAEQTPCDSHLRHAHLRHPVVESRKPPVTSSHCNGFSHTLYTPPVAVLPLSVGFEIDGTLEHPKLSQPEPPRGATSLAYRSRTPQIRPDQTL